MRIDLHPEELLDREREGTLSDRERARLEAHRAQCASCALEARWRDDLGGAPDDEDRALAAAAVARLFAAADDPAARPDVADAPSSGRLAPPASGGRRRLGAVAAAAALVLTLAGGVFAASLLFGRADPASPADGRRDASDREGPPARREPTKAAPSARTAPEARGDERGAPVASRRPTRAGPDAIDPDAIDPDAIDPDAIDPDAIDPDAIDPDAIDPETMAPETIDRETAAPETIDPETGRGRPVARVRTTPSSAAARAGPPEPSPEAPAVGDLGADALFSRANRARRAGRHAEAARLYRRLQRRHPGTRPEITSRVTLGYLLLTRLGDPAGALPRFDSYLAAEPQGAMAEEARVGRARALGRLGRRREERRAWETLLAEHPDTLQAGRARRRLEELAR
ncbi:MAG TPA: hypothetical protein RMH99_13705 [Sandaracinaceae bacterium LLY-WYZ-13_1]|nr:hypothetical protein [Sandaracinaceae bacterium LLY-WYZ-13_1]